MLLSDYACWLWTVSLTWEGPSRFPCKQLHNNIYCKFFSADRSLSLFPSTPKRNLFLYHKLKFSIFVFIIVSATTTTPPQRSVIGLGRCSPPATFPTHRKLWAALCVAFNHKLGEKIWICVQIDSAKLFDICEKQLRALRKAD